MSTDTSHDETDAEELAAKIDRLQPLLDELAEDLEEARELVDRLENVQRVERESERRHKEET